MSGNKLCCTIKSTPLASTLDATTTEGPIAKNDSKARSIPIIPAEKLFTNISKPLLILPSTALSNCLIIQPPNGPTIIAPKNIGIDAPTTTPMVVMAPTTPPRSP